MSDRNREVTRSTAGPFGDGATDNPLQVVAEELDDAQLAELVAEAYWQWFERFIAFERKGADALPLVSAS